MTTYSIELAEKFCAALAEGKGVRSVCRMKGMPSKAAVFKWLREYPEFAKLYDIATDERADTQVEEIVEIADNCKPDADSVRKAKLQIYARVEAAQRMKPKKYGNRVQLGGDPDNPLGVVVTVKDYTGRKRDGEG